MKSILAAMLFAFALSANAGMVYAHDDEHEGYEQHESKDHGDKDSYERGDREHGEHDRHEHGDSRRGDQHAAEHGASHTGGGAESGHRIMPDWWPF